MSHLRPCSEQGERTLLSLIRNYAEATEHFRDNSGILPGILIFDTLCAVSTFYIAAYKLQLPFIYLSRRNFPLLPFTSYQAIICRSVEIGLIDKS